MRPPAWSDAPFFAQARRALAFTARALPPDERGEWLDSEAQRLAEDLAELAAERADELSLELRDVAARRPVARRAA